MRKGWALLLLLYGCSAQPAIPPGSIVSNNPCIDAVLAQIAAPGQIGAVSIYSHDPASASAPLEWAKAFPPLGTGAEDVILARPKLLLTGNLAAGGTNKALAKAGVQFKAFGVPASVEENKDQIREIAKAIGREQAGADLAARISAATKPSKVKAGSAIIWQSGGFVPGKGTLQDEMLKLAGYSNASANYGLQQWSQLPLETLIRNPPDVIFMPVSGSDANGRELAMRRKLLGKVKDRSRIIGFPDSLLFCGGPAIIEAMKVMRAAAVPIPAASGEKG